MISINFIKCLFACALLSLSLNIYGQKKQNNYNFTEIVKLQTTPVKFQGKTGTCWSFATTSFIESELIRMGKEETDLSEMFFVRQSYIDRAKLYVRFHGHLNFTMGAQAWDVINVIRNDGMVPQKAMPGKIINPEKHDHEEMDGVLKAYINKVIENKGGKLSPVWMDGFKGILTAYLGEYPEKFQYRNADFTPAEFTEKMQINPDDYIPLTSFSNHDYYSTYIFESPDNWSMEEIYNIPLNKLTEAVHHALKQGYTVAWAADVSDKGFRNERGLAIVPQKKWSEMKNEEIVFNKPVAQKTITAPMRQKDFDNYSTTDDHLMHIVGMAKDQLGTNYFIVKNSWGKSNPYGGFLYVSEAYFKFKTTSLLMNKKSIPADIQEKLKL